MALTHKWYGQAFVRAFSSTGLDLAAGDVTALLTDDTYTPDQDADAFLDDVTGELSGGGYARVDLTSEGVTYDAGTNTLTFDADPIVFAALTGTFRHVVIFVDSGTASTSPLVSVVSSDSDLTASGGNVTVTPHANGLASVTIA